MQLQLPSNQQILLRPTGETRPGRNVVAGVRSIWKKQGTPDDPLGDEVSDVRLGNTLFVLFGFNFAEKNLYFFEGSHQGFFAVLNAQTVATAGDVVDPGKLVEFLELLFIVLEGQVSGPLLVDVVNPLSFDRIPQLLWLARSPFLTCFLAVCFLVHGLPS